MRPNAQPSVTIPKAPNASKGVDIKAAIRLEIRGPPSVRKKSTVQVLNVSRISVRAKLKPQTIQNWRIRSKARNCCQLNPCFCAPPCALVARDFRGKIHQLNSTIPNSTADGALM